mmetsp:Transcript_17947/g.41607  ORF Transcript_17947/g.41607 Transcript_17947/m.41607 type:complete len:300 (-) Transcript_17947:2086-2985(-)
MLLHIFLKDLQGLVLAPTYQVRTLLLEVDLIDCLHLNGSANAWVSCYNIHVHTTEGVVEFLHGDVLHLWNSARVRLVHLYIRRPHRHHRPDQLPKVIGREEAPWVRSKLIVQGSQICRVAPHSARECFMQRLLHQPRVELIAAIHTSANRLGKTQHQKLPLALVQVRHVHEVRPVLFYISDLVKTPEATNNSVQESAKVVYAGAVLNQRLQLQRNGVNVHNHHSVDEREQVEEANEDKHSECVPCVEVEAIGFSLALRCVRYKAACDHAHDTDGVQPLQIVERLSITWLVGKEEEIDDQ